MCICVYRPSGCQWWRYFIIVDERKGSWSPRLDGFNVPWCSTGSLQQLSKSYGKHHWIIAPLTCSYFNWDSNLLGSLCTSIRTEWAFVLPFTMLAMRQLTLNGAVLWCGPTWRKEDFHSGEKDTTKLLTLITNLSTSQGDIPPLNRGYRDNEQELWTQGWKGQERGHRLYHANSTIWLLTLRLPRLPADTRSSSSDA